MSNSDLISRKEAIETFSLALKDCNPELDPIHIRVLSSAIHLLEDEPAVDAAPVVHARWIDHKDEHQCSACKEFTIVDAYVWMQLRYDFCPYCGARMGGEDSDE